MVRLMMSQTDLSLCF
jgi:hypothetical protein